MTVSLLAALRSMSPNSGSSVLKAGVPVFSYDRPLLWAFGPGEGGFLDRGLRADFPEVETDVSSTTW